MSTGPDPAAARLQGHVALLAVQLCFGLFPLFGKLAMDTFAPTVVAGWRVTIGALALSAVAIARNGWGKFWPRRQDLLRLQVCALLGVALNQALYLEGLQRAPSVNAGVVMVLIPIFVSVLAVLVGQERWQMRRMVGVLIAAAGAAVLLLRRGPDLGSEYLIGNLLMITNAFSYSIYVVLAKPLASRMPMVLIAWVFLLSLWTVPLIAGFHGWAPAAAGRGAWLSLGYVLLFPTLLGYLLHTVALARVSASTTAFYVFLQPVIAAIAGWTVLGETLDAQFLLAAALIVIGLVKTK